MALVNYKRTTAPVCQAGTVAHRDGLVRFRRAGRDLAVATVERDKESLRAELAMEGEVRRNS
jgi:hypothetical protein